MRAFWDIAPCGLIEIDVSEVPTATINRAVMEVICTSETCLLQWEYMVLYPRRLSSSV
jgi:hypothetical protein